MPSNFLQSGVPDAHTTTRQRLTNLLDLPKLYQTIDADPAIAGAGVVHIGSDYQVTVLREFVPLCSISPKRVPLLRSLAAAGFRSGPVLLVVVATLNAMLAADYLGNHPVTMFAVFPLFQSLACLLMLNTRNHRRFVSMLRVRRRRKTRVAESFIH
ncbi:hypothetical protein DYL61_12200 [Pseudomonas nabeulensis]|uniref:Uncharacterized protein n=1 Tax=Pseudomonas nabeulensis TaxID=2293833 RepID=A0A4Z0B555_9PSED|nr:hypothetical protein [Pseudomonas nabeulensis]TFY93703.1 hypothetical protein DYL61_12200 [Pseudomonas nabeulensis]